MGLQERGQSLNFDSGKVTGVIFKDFRGAFDSVNHEVLFYVAIMEMYYIGYPVTWKTLSNLLN